MGELVRQYLPPLLAWLLLLIRKPGNDHARRDVRRMLLGLAIALTALTPGGHTLINTLAGTHNLPRLIAHAGMLLAAWAGQELLLHVNGLRRTWHTWWMTGMFCLLCTLFALTPDLLPQSPWVFEYVLTYTIAQLPAYADIIRLCLRHTRIADTTALRVALRMVVTGITLAATYLVNKVIVGAASRMDFDYAFGRTTIPGKILPTTAYLLVLIGAVLPAMLAWLSRHRRYRQLGPLWRALYRADPAIALDPPTVPDILVLRRIRLRLYRRVIEIRDGLLALRPYRDPGIATTAHHRATQAGLHGQRLHATVEATVIAAALHARAADHPPRTTDDTTIAGGDDLATETAFLGLVARAYRDLTPPDLHVT
ncbi:MAB_1171c family putative transporter [Actinophytocola algeriensis]|uniref:DUF6545 domain-containing protein n=1 Tax=Actinophytocola algeriensis TaxID=1768010 RepID=A0A7W7QBZ2_9PSEU|nr:MAB_1171c family putative transporter [Actinophytocola algeriensis]MBB4910850.1 hypothetical protein [Actinophytocola algeriensis]MBE1473843.1 hypothetical protein [Actinophytocola algeriensis]